MFCFSFLDAFVMHGKRCGYNSLSNEYAWYKYLKSVIESVEFGVFDCFALCGLRLCVCVFV